MVKKDRGQNEVKETHPCTLWHPNQGANSDLIITDYC